MGEATGSRNSRSKVSWKSFTPTKILLHRREEEDHVTRNPKFSSQVNGPGGKYRTVKRTNPKSERPRPKYRNTQKRLNR